MNGPTWLGILLVWTTITAAPGSSVKFERQKARLSVDAEVWIPGWRCSWNENPAATNGHDLFLLNCAHCHGDDARGTEEGPDLTKTRKSDARIAATIRNGIKGEMPRFDQKLTDADVATLIRFIRSLKSQAR